MHRLHLSYSLFLCTLLVPIAAALALASAGRATRPVLQVGPVAGTCATARAAARVTARKTVRAPVSASPPAEAVALRSSVAASATARVASRACARAKNLGLAHRMAVLAARRTALARARTKAAQRAAVSLVILVERTRRALAAEERLVLTARAPAVAVGALAIRLPPAPPPGPRRPA